MIKHFILLFTFIVYCSTFTTSFAEEQAYYPPPPAWVFELSKQDICHPKELQKELPNIIQKIQHRTYYKMWEGSLTKRGINPITELAEKLKDQESCHGRLLSIQKQFYKHKNLNPNALDGQIETQDILAFDVIRTVYQAAFEATVLHELTSPFPDFDYRGLKDLLRTEYNEDVNALLTYAKLVHTLEFSLQSDLFISEGSQQIKQALESFQSPQATLYLTVLDSSGTLITLLLFASEPNYYLFDPRFPGSLVPGREEEGRFASLEDLLNSSLTYLQEVYYSSSEIATPLFIQVAIYEAKIQKQ